MELLLSIACNLCEIYSILKLWMLSLYVHICIIINTEWFRGWTHVPSTWAGQLEIVWDYFMGLEGLWCCWLPWSLCSSCQLPWLDPENSETSRLNWCNKQSNIIVSTENYVWLWLVLIIVWTYYNYASIHGHVNLWKKIRIMFGYGWFWLLCGLIIIMHLLMSMLIYENKTWELCLVMVSSNYCVDLLSLCIYSWAC